MDAGKSKEWTVHTNTTIADTSTATVAARLSAVLQLRTTAVTPYYSRSKLAHAIANNVVITAWCSLAFSSWTVGACECGVGDKAVAGEENF